MTATPSGAVRSPPSARPRAIGAIPAIMAMLVINTGLNLLAAPRTAAEPDG